MQKDLENKITQSSDAGRFDYEKAVDEIDATQMAKPAGPVRGLLKGTRSKPIFKSRNTIRR